MNLRQLHRQKVSELHDAKWKSVCSPFQYEREYWIEKRRLLGIEVNLFYWMMRPEILASIERICDRIYGVD